MRSMVRSMLLGVMCGISTACVAGAGADDDADLESVAEDRVALVTGVAATGFEGTAAKEAALTGGGPRDVAPPSGSLDRSVAQAKPERSECRLICIFGVCITCCGFPSDDDSWTCTVIDGELSRSP